jgi:hypothetical protein
MVQERGSNSSITLSLHLKYSNVKCILCFWIRQFGEENILHGRILRWTLLGGNMGTTVSAATLILRGGGEEACCNYSQ